MLANDIKPVEKPTQLPAPQFGVGIELLEVNELIRTAQARHEFNADGQGLTVAVLDTGLNTAHVDFVGRVPVQVNFTSDNDGDAEDATDGHGHGTNVAGIIVANGDHLGVAPGAQVIPIKVLRNNGNGTFDAVDQALRWVLEHRRKHNISAVCMSLGGSQNFTSDSFLGNDAVRQKIRELRDQKVAVVIAAGNDFFTHGSQEGMSYPAIIRECVSVGAVYDAEEGPFFYNSGAAAFSTGPDRITPFTQRLHPTTNAFTFTDIFAPGAPVTSSGIDGEHGESVQHGTSQATPVTVGVILLAQQFYHRIKGELPDVDELVGWLRKSGITINDGDDEHDNVHNTYKDYIRIDALAALRRMRREIELLTLKESGLLKEGM